MPRIYNSKNAVAAYLSECTSLSEEIVYEIGERNKPTSFLGGLLQSVELPDVTIKPHKDMIYLIGGTVLALSATALGVAYIIKNR